MCFWQIFSHSPLKLCGVFFTEQQLLISMKSSLSIKFFMYYAFIIISKKLSPYSRSSRCYSIYLLGVSYFCTWHLDLWSIFIQFNFTKGVRSVSTHVFSCGCPVLPPSFVEKTSFVPFHCLCSFVKNSWLNFWGSIYEPSILFHLSSCLLFHQYETVFITYLYSKSWSQILSVLQLVLLLNIVLVSYKL